MRACARGRINMMASIQAAAADPLLEARLALKARLEQRLKAVDTRLAAVRGNGSLVRMADCLRQDRRQIVAGLEGLRRKLSH